jgi:hypothetical protein
MTRAHLLVGGLIAMSLGALLTGLAGASLNGAFLLGVLFATLGFYAVLVALISEPTR